MWSPDGSSLAILDKSSAQFCLLYEDQSDTSRSSEDTTPRRWEDGAELSHVLEEEEAGASVLSSLAEAEALWTDRRARIMA